MDNQQATQTKKCVSTLFAAMLSALFCAQTVLAIEADWESKRLEDGIEVLTGNVEGSAFKAVRSVTTMVAPMAQLVAIIRDTANCSDLSELCKEAYAHKVVSETQLYIYNYNDLPWPVTDRDAMTHVVWSRDASTGTVRMKATVVGDIIPPKKKTIRLTYGETVWILTPQDSTTIKIVSESHIDPQGSVPAWITNKLLLDAPFDTLQNLRKLAASDRHATATFEFLSAKTPPLENSASAEIN